MIIMTVSNWFISLALVVGLALILKVAFFGKSDIVIKPGPGSGGGNGGNGGDGKDGGDKEV